MNPPLSTTLAVLADHKFMNLTTFRRDGREVTTTVWFAQVVDKIYVMTMRDTGKVKRLRQNPAARLRPSDRRGQPLGPQIAAVGRILADSERTPAIEALRAKYGFPKRLFDLLFKLRGKQMQQVYLEFRAAELH